MSKKEAPGKPVKPETDDDLTELRDVIETREVSELYHNSYLSRSTIARLKQGKTRYPQHMTMKGIAEAAGFEYVLRRRPRRK